VNKEIEELLNKAKDIAKYGADGKQHIRMFNQFEAKALLSYIEQLEKKGNDALYYESKYYNEAKKVDKAIEYIENGEILNTWGEYMPFKKFGYGKELLNILKGDSDE
jgi:hypothetical protein